ncbi:hypothetical protein [Gluconacetobacter diazotrophicus]|uniref:hypothetical protein n=1 Tax=Gluconacetobacter diazotrophicus TaxID=33996 RepID=UPI001199D76A|nr:hypothetical protein [Gluconacetobacter diazotrophicus]TWB05631.1 hypothetical protein FBZ86_11558 [Gluconacetobacter diazotrophicus]
MAKTTRRSVVNLTMSVEELTADLAQEHEEWLSRKPQTVYDLVKQIHEPLLKMKQDGRTDSEICDMLTKRGIEISAGTFATYMKRIAKETRGGASRRPTRKPKPDSDAAADKVAASNSNYSRTSKPARPTSDSAPAEAASPSMSGFTSRKPPSLDA